MASSDHRAPRLFLEAGLEPGAGVLLDKAQANYLGNVLRLASGDAVIVFNGRDGEWRARLGATGRKALALTPEERLRGQTWGPDLHYLFAPLKHARLDYMVQKATEMGVSRLVPVITRRTVATRINLDRMRANAIEAAEQCGLLGIPGIATEEPLDAAIGRLEPERLLVFCDEAAPGEPSAAGPLATLGALATPSPDERRLAVLVGPEGGFTAGERALVRARPNTVVLSLGPRILRADTAAVAALALVQGVLGEWAGQAGVPQPPSFETGAARPPQDGG